MPVCLKSEYVQVCKNGLLSYGGSQLWSDKPVIRKCGCGPVAALDTAIYLSRACGRGLEQIPDGPVPLSVYNSLLSRLCGKYFPLIPPFGINPAVLCLGLNRLLHDEQIPRRAHVVPASEKIWPRIEAGLREDSPSLLAIGQNFPYVWQKNRLRFYRRLPDGSRVPASSAKAHFVAVTGMEDDWLRISSWGQAYEVSRLEFAAYVQEYSANLLNGLIYLTP